MKLFSLPKTIERNIPLFYILRAVELPIFILPISYVYLTEIKGFDPLQTAFILGLQEFALIFLEVPTGIVADKVSRKFSVALGYFLTWFMVMFLPFFSSFYAIVIIWIFRALGKALTSGADSSLLFDTLVDLKREDEYKNILRKSRAYTFAVSTVCIFLGAQIYQYNVNIPFFLGFPIALIGIIAVVNMIEPEVTKEGKTKQEANYFTHTISAFKYIIKDRYIVILVILFSIIEGMAVQLKWIYNPIFAELGLGIGLIGGLTTLLYLSKTFISYVNSKFPDNILYNIIIPVCSSLFFFILLSFVFNPYVAFIAMLMEIFSQGMLISYTQNLIHKRLDSSIRATAMSGINLISSIFATLIIWGFGYFQLKFNIQYAVGYIAFIYILVAILSIYFIRIRKN